MPTLHDKARAEKTPRDEKSFRTIPNEFIKSTKLSSYAKLLLLALAAHQNHKSGRCDPGIKCLAEELSVSHRTIHRALVELSSVGLIRIRRRQRTSQYEVAPIHEWLKILICPTGTSETPDVPHRQNKFCPTGTSDGRPSINELNEVNYKASSAAAAARTRTAAAAAHNSSNKSPRTQHPDNTPGAVTELLNQHPKTNQPDRAPPEVEKILQASTDAEATAAVIRSSHAKWCEYWSLLPAGEYIPHLWRWFQEGYWEHPPPEAAFAALKKPAQSQPRRKSRLEEAFHDAASNK